MRLLKKLIPFIYIILSLLATFFWFKEHEILAGLEEGLVFTEFEKSFRRSQYLWQEYVLLGVNQPAFFGHILFGYFGFFLSSHNIANADIQRVVFGAAFAINGIGMYFLTLYFLKGRKERYLCAFIAGLFYMFNAFSFLSIWNRFILSFIFVSPVIPFCLLFYSKLLKEAKVLYIYLMVVLFSLLCLTFNNPSNIIIIFFLLSVYLLFFSYENWSNKKKVLNAYQNSFFLLIAVIIVSLWWLVSYSSSSKFFTQAFSTEDNIMSLKGVSQHFTLRMVIRGINPSILYNPDYWGKIYTTTFFEILSFIPPVVVFLTIGFKIKERIVWFFGFITIVVLFVMKGTNPPFGGLLVLSFIHFPVMQAFRNPYEKFGLLWPLCYSFLFGYGIGHFYYWMKQKLEYLEINKRSFYNYFPQEIVKKICNNFKECTMSKPKY